MRQIASIVLLIVCIFLLSYERRMEVGKWQIRGIFLALTGVFLDGTGIFFSSSALKSVPTLDPIAANAVRGCSAVLGFVIFSRFLPYRWIATFKKIPTRTRINALTGTFLGTVMGLSLWLAALQVGRLSVLSAIGGLSPILTFIIESILEKKAPSLLATLSLSTAMGAFYLLLK